MLKRCLTLSTAAQFTDNRWRCSITIMAKNVGHRVPTGFIDRHVILTVEALDKSNQRLSLIDGPTLPAVAGLDLKARPGRLFAKRMVEKTSDPARPFWRSKGEVVDTRLLPEQPTTSTFTFPSNAARLRVKLYYRRFWANVVREKRWPDDTLTVEDRIIVLSR